MAHEDLSKILTDITHVVLLIPIFLVLLEVVFIHSYFFCTVHMATSPPCDGQHASISVGVCQFGTESRFAVLRIVVSNLVIMMSSVRIMMPRRDPRSSVEPSFPDVAQLGEVIANAIQASLHPPSGLC